MGSRRSDLRIQGTSKNCRKSGREEKSACGMREPSHWGGVKGRDLGIPSNKSSICTPRWERRDWQSATKACRLLRRKSRTGKAESIPSTGTPQSLPCQWSPTAETWETGQPQQMTVTEGKGPATTHVGTGLPTCQELLDHYPAKFTWQELKMFVNSGSVLRNCFQHLPLTDDPSDLGLLKRDRMLQLRYNDWSEEIKKKWGTLGA